MKLQARKDSLICLIIASIGFILILCSSTNVIEDFLFVMNIFLMFVIIAVAQFSLLSLVTIISDYMLINVYTVYRTGMGYGLLALSSKIYMKEMDIALLVFNFSILLWCLFSNVLTYEKKLFICDWKLKKTTCNIYAVFAVIMAYIAYPSLQMGLTVNRFQSLLPGHFWNHFMLIFMILATQKIKESHLVKVSVILITIWVLLHGERVDVIGYYAYFFLQYCIKKNYSVNLKFILRFGTVFFIAFFLFVYIGDARVGNTYVKDFSSMVGSILSQGTASDVGFVFNSAIDYTHKYPHLLGKTYITYVQGIIPFLDNPYRAGKIIQQIYNTAGGEFLLTEPMINFGLIGIVIIPNIIIAFMKSAFKKSSPYKSLVYMFMVAASFRVVWYGPTYIETGLLYLIPIAWGIGKIKIRNKV